MSAQLIPLTSWCSRHPALGERRWLGPPRDETCCCARLRGSSPGPRESVTSPASTARGGPCEVGRVRPVEVMAGGGYLLNRFLSPLTNKREDSYGVKPREPSPHPARDGGQHPDGCRRRLPRYGAAQPPTSIWRGLFRPTTPWRWPGCWTVVAWRVSPATPAWHESAPCRPFQRRWPKAGFAHLRRAKDHRMRAVVAANRHQKTRPRRGTPGRWQSRPHWRRAGVPGRPRVADEGARGPRRRDRACIACSNCLSGHAVTTYKHWAQPVSTWLRRESPAWASGPGVTRKRPATDGV